MIAATVVAYLFALSIMLSSHGVRPCRCHRVVFAVVVIMWRSSMLGPKARSKSKRGFSALVVMVKGQPGRSTTLT
jgi:hypothetical protein